MVPVRCRAADTGLRNPFQSTGQIPRMNRRVCIVGGGGGASNAASMVRRLDQDATVDIFTDRPEIGNQPCEIPFVLRGDLPDWDDTFVFKSRFYRERDINVHFETRISEIGRASKTLEAAGTTYDYDKLILDLGAIPIVPPIAGLDGAGEYALSTTLESGKRLQTAMETHSDAAILGVGQIGIEIAAALKARGYRSVHLIGRSSRVLRAYLDEEFARKVEARVEDAGIELHLSSTVNRVESRNDRKVLHLAEGDLEVGFIVFATGSRPNAALAQEAGIELGATGAIAVNEYLQTSDPDIYAIGDCSENRDRILEESRLYKTATSAARGGRIAAANAVLGNTLPYQGTTMPFIMEALGLQVGTVGLTEREARQKGIDLSSLVTTTATRRRMFGGKTINLKLIADRRNRTLIGAQVLSEELVAGKIDRLALAIAEKVPVDRLALTDTCYYPTSGTAYEPVVMALDNLRLHMDGYDVAKR